MTRYPTKRAVSAGGLIVEDRPDGRWVVLISRRSAAGELQWTLPKGGLEDGEDLQRAAVREVLEETGLGCAIVRELGVVDYWFVWRPDEVRYHKYVHYFVMLHLGGEPQPRDDEAEDVEWLPLEEALARLSHPNERRLVEQVAAEPAGRFAPAPAADLRVERDLSAGASAGASAGSPGGSGSTFGERTGPAPSGTPERRG